MVVNSTDFTVTLQEGSTFTVTSSGRAKFSVDSPKPLQVSRPCTSTESSLTLQGGNDVTVIITPSSTCDATTSTASSGGGGGGTASSPGVITTTSTQTETETATETTEEEETTKVVSTAPSSSSLTQGQVDAIIDLLKAFDAEQSVIDNVMASLTGSGSSQVVVSSITTNVSSVFTKGLSRGESNSDIKRLQQLLNSDPDTVVASTGVGSVGNETNYFGSLTEKAVQKFQMKYSVVSSPSDLGYGYVGPKTRAKLFEVFGQ